jgi:hypothetical protein
VLWAVINSNPVDVMPERTYGTERYSAGQWEDRNRRVEVSGSAPQIPSGPNGPWDLDPPAPAPCTQHKHAARRQGVCCTTCTSTSPFGPLQRSDRINRFVQNQKRGAHVGMGLCNFRRLNAACYRLVLESLGQKACRACAGFRSVSNGASPP